MGPPPPPPHTRIRIIHKPHAPRPPPPTHTHTHTHTHAHAHINILPQGVGQNCRYRGIFCLWKRNQHFCNFGNSEWPNRNLVSKKRNQACISESWNSIYNVNHSSLPPSYHVHVVSSYYLSLQCTYTWCQVLMYLRNTRKCTYTFEVKLLLEITFYQTV